MTRRTQDESEQPAKVYQLDAVESKVDEANKKLDDLLRQTSNLVTKSDLEDSEVQQAKYVDEEIKKVHLTYGPMKRNATWFVRSVVVAIIGQIVVTSWSVWMVLKG